MKLSQRNAVSVVHTPRRAPLPRRCERALVAAALSTRLSTRKRVLKASRAFVRRHSGRRAFLAWVVERVASNAKLAIALLGLGSIAGLQPGIASAVGAPVFDRFLTTSVPFNAPGPQPWIAPALGDLDQDGDLDLVLGLDDGALAYFENVGNSTTPDFVHRIGDDDPFSIVPQAQRRVVPALVDIDGDGRIDVIAADDSGTFSFYLHNTGSPTAPAFEYLQSGILLPPLEKSATVSAGDLDDDGDLDLAIGQGDGLLRYFENTGDAMDLTKFLERTGSANPFNAFFLPVNPPADQCAAPALGDLDSDGDLDVVVGRADSTMRYLENRGTSTYPRFHAHLQAANPLNGESTAGCSRIAIGDLDADGDADLVVGDQNGGIFAFKNQRGQLVPSNEIDVSSLVAPSSSPVVPGADFDGDGDLSLFSADCAFADNTGSAINPSFVSSILPNFGPACIDEIAESVDLDGDGDFDVSTGTTLRINGGTRTSPSFGTQLPLFATLPGYFPPRASFGDVEGDGDFDATVIYSNSSIGSSEIFSKYFENTGNANAPSFVERAGVANPLPPSSNTYQFLDDYDSDGDVDMVESDRGNSLRLYWENVGTRTVPAFRARPLIDRRSPFRAFFDPITGFGVVPPLKLGDFDGDGDRDGFGLRFVLGATPPIRPVFLESGIILPAPRYRRAAPTDPIETFPSIGQVASPAIADLDADGDPDFIVGEGYSPPNFLHYIENTGNAHRHQLTERFGAANPLGAFSNPTNEIIRLAVGDLDGDRDFDLIVTGGSLGDARFIENVGTIRQPAFVEQVGAGNPFDSMVLGYRAAPAIADIDRDGDLDFVVSNDYPSSLRYFENTGNAEAAAFTERTGAASPFSGLNVGISFTNPALCDVDLDGDVDLVSSDYDSNALNYFENTGAGHLPAFVASTGVADPFDGIAVDLYPGLACVDLEGDGDNDLVAGEWDGTMAALYVPEPSRGLMLGVGLSLLAWLRDARAKLARKCSRGDSSGANSLSARLSSGSGRRRTADSEVA